MKRASLHAAITTLLAALSAQPALAKTSTRQGLNFGTTVRSLDTNEQTAADGADGHNTVVQNGGEGINAYVGYAFTSLDFGVMYSTETSTTQTTSTTPDGATTTVSSSEVTDRGGSLYVRYLFASYFYFKAGAGLYQQTMKVKTTTTQNAGGGFSGNQDEHDFTGEGPGYDVGGGIELPVTNGFYFTAAYQARMVALRDHVTSTDIGTNRSQEQKHEVLFGVAYYDH